MEPRISNEVNPGRDGQNPLFRFPRFRATKLGGSWSRVFFSQVLSWTWCCLLSVSQAITTLHLRISWPSCFASISAHAHQGSRKGPLVVHHSVQVAQLVFLCTVSSQVVRSLCSGELFFFAGQPVCNLLRDPIYSARTNPAFPRHPPCPSQSGGGGNLGGDCLGSNSLGRSSPGGNSLGPKPTKAFLVRNFGGGITAEIAAPLQPPLQHVAHNLLSPKPTQASLVGNFGGESMTSPRKSPHHFSLHCNT